MNYKSILLAFSLQVIFTSVIVAQEKNQALAGISPSLQPQLIRQLERFTEYQRNQEWEKIRSLLTEFYMHSSVWKVKHTQKELDDMLQRIKERPVFKFVPKETWISTAHKSRPLSERDWLIWGCAEYQKGGDIVYAPAGIRANLKNRQWRFSNFLFQEKTERYSCSEKDKKATEGQR